MRRDRDVTMGIKLKPITNGFGAYASGINLSGKLSKKATDEIEAGMDMYAVLVWRDSAISDDALVNLAERFGKLEISFLSKVRGKSGPDNKSLVPISNVEDNGQILERDGRRLGSQIANQFWHSDSSFMRSVAKYSFLSARRLPKEGGDTEFADLRAAYETLPNDLKILIEGLVAEHHVFHSRMALGLIYTPEEIAASPPAYWPLVRIHPSTKRKVVFPPVHIRSINGMSDPEARLLVTELIEHSTQKCFCFTHKWEKGDLVIWDNRVTLHRGKRYNLNEPRILRRITTMQP